MADRPPFSFVCRFYERRDATQRHQGVDVSDSDFSSGDIAAAVDVASGASPAPDSLSTDSQPSSASADATAPQGDAQATGQQPSTQGVPPEQRWPAILENARKEAADKASAEWKQYEWAKQVNREQIEQVVGIAQKYQRDPVGYLQELIAEVQSHPEHGARLRSLAARALSQGRGQAPSQDGGPVQPDVTITDAQGQPVGQAYSAEAISKLVAQVQQQTLAQVRQEFAPVVKTAQHVEQERATLAAQSFASSTFDDLSKTLPGFKEHAAEIGQRLKALNLETDDPRILTMAVKALHSEVVLPKLHTLERSQVLNDLNQKARASVHVPGQTQANPARQLKDMSWEDALSAEWDRKFGAGA